MALPTRVKTYKYEVGKAIAASGTLLTTMRNLVWGIYNTMTNGGAYTDVTGAGSTLDSAAQWTVVASSDSSTAATGASKWVTATNLVWASSGAHSWIVLKQTNIATNFSICIDLFSSANSYSIGVYCAPNGYSTSGLVTTARPSPTQTGGEITLIATGTTWVNTADAAYKVQSIFSTDGTVAAIIVCTNSLPVAMWYFAKPQSPVTGWTTPALAMAITGATANVLTPTNLYATANLKGFKDATINSALTVNCFMTAEAYNNTLLTTNQTVVNDFSADSPMLPVGIASTSTSCRGRHGTLFDLYFGLDNIAQGSTYPNDSTRLWAQFGSLIVPWNSSVVTML